MAEWAMAPGEAHFALSGGGREGSYKGTMQCLQLIEPVGLGGSAHGGDGRASGVNGRTVAKNFGTDLGGVLLKAPNGFRP